MKPVVADQATKGECHKWLEDANVQEEEVVRCRCRLFHDEGLMVQCERCETWQHSDCLGKEKCKSALASEHYVCDACLKVKLRNQDLDIVLTPQPDNPPEGHVFYLSLHYQDLQVRQGDCVYVLRDHDTPDSKRILWNDGTLSDPTPRVPAASTAVRIANLDIFQIERMWIDEHGNKYIWGHHYLRPHETFHEPSRKFYVNEVLHVPIYEAIPVWAIAGRCWVLDTTTFCKGRPVDAVEEHIYVCEYRVDRSARLFAKVARTKFPVCTRRFAFNSFASRFKPQRTYQPHGAPPAAGGGRKSLTPAAADGVVDSKCARKQDKKIEKKKKKIEPAVSSVAATKDKSRDGKVLI